MTRDFAAEYSTARDRVFAVLSDCQWHSHTELANAAGVRYGARLLELKRLGYRIDSQDRRDHGRNYRLVSIHPDEPQRKRVKALLDEDDVISLLRGDVTLTASAALRDALGSYRQNKGKL